MRERKMMAILIWILGCCFVLIHLPGRSAPLVFVCWFSFNLAWFGFLSLIFYFPHRESSPGQQAINFQS